MATTAGAYRSLLRASKVAFENDARTLSEARVLIRDRFRGHDPGPGARNGLEEAFEAARILRRNVVQGVMDEGDPTFRLRIHDEIELGDNISVKKGGNGDGGGGGGCCS